MPSTKKPIYAMLIFLIFTSLPWITYFNTLHNDFVFDDLPLIQKNKTLPSLKTIDDIFNLFTQKQGYRPLRALSYAIDYHFSGLNPLSYHISNITYHIINSFLVYLLTLFLLENKVTALLAALLFSLHPVHTESVTYLAGRRDLLFTLFYLSGFYAFLKYRQTTQPLFLISAMAAYLLSIGAKEMGVTLPALFLIYDLIKDLPQEADRLRLNPAKELLHAFKKLCVHHKYFYGLFFLGALALSYYKAFIHPISYQKAYYGDSIVVTFLTTCKIIIHYLKSLLFPVNLVADYSYDVFPLASSIFEWSTSLSLLVLVAILLIIFWSLISHKWIAFGSFWFFITLLPVCHLIPHHELMAEHFLYLPSYGFCLIGAIFFTALREKRRYPFLVSFVVILIMMLFSLRIIDRNQDWKNGMTLWGKTVNTVPRCARAQGNLGAEYLLQQNYPQAMRHLKAALDIKPTYAEAYNNLGIAYKELGFYDQAFDAFLKAFQLKKRYVEPLQNIANIFVIKKNYKSAFICFNALLKSKPDSAQVYNDMGIAYQQQGEHELAKQHFYKALELNPHYVEARNNLGVWYKNHGMYDEAIEEFKQVLELKPDFAEVHGNLGTVYSNKGLYDEAINEFKRALQLKPHFLDAMNNLGNAYRGKGQYDQTIATFNRMLKINPNRALPHVNLAITYLYQIKDNKKALYHFERALALDPNFPHAEAIRKQIEELKKQSPLQ
jgi:tetratricopeptide (TPR) repeat protein